MEFNANQPSFQYRLIGTERSRYVLKIGRLMCLETGVVTVIPRLNEGFPSVLAFQLMALKREYLLVYQKIRNTDECLPSSSKTESPSAVVTASPNGSGSNDAAKPQNTLSSDFHLGVAIAIHRSSGA